jgi:hypothetical protein
MRRVRALGALTLVVGIGVLSIVPATDLFHRASSGRRILSDFHQTMSPQGLVALQENLAPSSALETSSSIRRCPASSNS